MSNPKKSTGWEIVTTLKANEFADRTPALQLSLKRPINIRKILLDNLSVTTGFWDNKQQKFFPSVHFTARYYQDMAVLFMTAFNMVIKLQDAVRSSRLVQETEQRSTQVQRTHPDVKPKELKVSIGEMLKAKK